MWIAWGAMAGFAAAYGWVAAGVRGGWRGGRTETAMPDADGVPTGEWRGEAAAPPGWGRAARE